MKLILFIQAKLSSWNTNYLLLSSQITIFNSVFIITAYEMSIFKLPSWIVSEWIKFTMTSYGENHIIV